MVDVRYLLDTNICIHIRRKRPKAVLDRFEVLPPGSAAISVITYGELVYGVRKSQDPAHALTVLDELIALIPVLPMPDEIGAIYGRIRSDLSTRGELIGNNDLWIAAHALGLGLTLVTNNVREFERAEGLPIEDWTVAPAQSE